jgi:hypothetical protein
MFEQNNIGVRLENPLLPFVKSVGPHSPLLMEVLEYCRAIANGLLG